MKELISLFENIFGDACGTKIFFSPGRVNLIGEHVDYNGGYVFPCALSLGSYGVARKRSDDALNFYSENLKSFKRCSVNDLKYEKDHDFANYLKGVIFELKKSGFKIGGMDILLYGNLPNAAGLSSSASIELLTSIICRDLFSCDIDMLDLVKLSQKAENEFVGVNCGIMDQFAVGMGKKDNAMLLDCTNIKCQYIPIILNGYSLMITNTNKKRELSDSKYNERRSECEEALKCLNKKLNIKNLAQITPEEFEEYKYLINDPTVLKRATHVIYEIERTILAAQKLKNNDIEAFGKLMIDSHNSLRDLYEVTGIELDTLVKEALKIHGVLGSRMTGAGFGGCTISIVKDESIDEFKSEIEKNYADKIGYPPSFYKASIGDGAKKLNVEKDQ